MRKSKSSKVSSLAMVPALGIPCSFLLGQVAGPAHPWVSPIALGLVVVAQIVIFYIRVRQSKKLRAAAKV